MVSSEDHLDDFEKGHESAMSEGHSKDTQNSELVPYKEGSPTNRDKMCAGSSMVSSAIILNCLIEKRFSG